MNPAWPCSKYDSPAILIQQSPWNTPFGLHPFAFRAPLMIITRLSARRVISPYIINVMTERRDWIFGEVGDKRRGNTWKKSSQWALKAGKAGPYLKDNPELHEWIFRFCPPKHGNSSHKHKHTHTYAAKKWREREEGGWKTEKERERGEW